jgi:hypothetical protein
LTRKRDEGMLGRYGRRKLLRSCDEIKRTDARLKELKQQVRRNSSEVAGEVISEVTAEDGNAEESTLEDEEFSPPLWMIGTKNQRRLQHRQKTLQIHLYSARDKRYWQGQDPRNVWLWNQELRFVNAKLEELREEAQQEEAEQVEAGQEEAHQEEAPRKEVRSDKLGVPSEDRNAQEGVPKDEVLGPSPSTREYSQKDLEFRVTMLKEKRLKLTHETLCINQELRTLRAKVYEVKMEALARKQEKAREEEARKEELQRPYEEIEDEEGTKKVCRPELEREVQDDDGQQPRELHSDIQEEEWQELATQQDTAQKGNSLEEEIQDEKKPQVETPPGDAHEGESPREEAQPGEVQPGNMQEEDSQTGDLTTDSTTLSKWQLRKARRQEVQKKALQQQELEQEKAKAGEAQEVESQEEQARKEAIHSEVEESGEEKTPKEDLPQGEVAQGEAEVGEALGADSQREQVKQLEDEVQAKETRQEKMPEEEISQIPVQPAQEGKAQAEAQQGGALPSQTQPGHREEPPADMQQKDATPPPDTQQGHQEKPPAPSPVKSSEKKNGSARDDGSDRLKFLMEQARQRARSWLGL